VMGAPAWASAAGLATAEGRQASIDAVEDGVRAWTAGLSREDVVSRCQAAGVPAGEMLTSLESVENAQYLSRGFRVEIEQPANLVPKLVLDGPGFYGSRMAPPVIGPAPLVGEHTREICRDLLGMVADEIEQLIGIGALEVTPPAV
jgi:crotonobetainyl-CoA:carnitine CoA-transferase CaiB-like acyl-CoA transferase